MFYKKVILFYCPSSYPLRSLMREIFSQVRSSWILTFAMYGWWYPVSLYLTRMTTYINSKAKKELKNRPSEKTQKFLKGKGRLQVYNPLTSERLPRFEPILQMWSLLALIMSAQLWLVGHFKKPITFWLLKMDFKFWVLGLLVAVF